MSSGWLSHTGDRLESKVFLRIPSQVLPGRIQREGMFLGYKVNADGLKVCPDKAYAVLSLPSPGCLKDVQKLNGKLARSQNSLQTDEETHHGSPNADRTKGKEGANHILSRDQGSYQCSLNDRKGGQANASVLCKLCPTRTRD
ncbi:hypothetical protein Tco_0918216 [Tanacetum coccineum]